MSRFSPVKELRLIRQIMADEGLTSSERLAVIGVVLNTNNETGLSWAAHQRIKDEYHLGGSTVSDAIKKAEGEYFRRYKRGRSGSLCYQLIEAQTKQASAEQEEELSAPTAGVLRDVASIPAPEPSAPVSESSVPTAGAILANTNLNTSIIENPDADEKRRLLTNNGITEPKLSSLVSDTAVSVARINGAISKANKARNIDSKPGLIVSLLSSPEQIPDSLTPEIATGLINSGSLDTVCGVTLPKGCRAGFNDNGLIIFTDETRKTRWRTFTAAQLRRNGQETDMPADVPIPNLKEATG